MKESFLKKLARSSLLVACLTLALMLCACSLSPTSAGNTASDPTSCTVQIQIDCSRTVISGRYDVSVSVDGEVLGSLEFNNKATFDAKLTKGQHELALKKAGSDQPEGKASLVVENEGDRFSYHVKLASDKIEVEPIDETSERQAVDTQVVSYGRCSFEVPSSWSVKDEENGKTAETEYGGVVLLIARDVSMEQRSADEAYDAFIKIIKESEDVTVTSDAEKVRVGTADAYRIGLEYHIENKNYIGAVECIVTEDVCYTIQIIVPEAAYSMHANDVVNILDSIELDEPQAQAPEDGSGQS